MREHTFPRTALAAGAAAAGLYLLSLRGRRDHPAWETLSRFRYAHRGLHDKAGGVPENSLAAFRRAARAGCGAELDVHLTRDGRLAVIHDDSLLRTAGTDVKISRLTAEELSHYRLEGTREHIPLLEEVLPVFEGRAPLIVELKVENNAAALAQAACETLDRFSVDYCVESFHPAALLWLRRHRPDVCRGQLSQDFVAGDHTGLGFAADFAMTHLLSSALTRPDFIAYHWAARREPSLRLSRKLWGVREVCWTVRDRETMERLESEGALIIFEGFLP